VASGVPLLGSDLEAIDQAEERVRFAALLDRLGIPQPEGGMAESIEEALTLAERIGYPVIVRPSFVIGGLAIDFAYSPEDLARHLAAAAIVDPDRPVRIDRFLEGIEVDIDAVCDGIGVLIPGLLEHVERAGVTRRLDRGVPAAARLGRRRGPDRAHDGADLPRPRCPGLVNAQFIVRDDGVYLIEVNPRASRTGAVPVEGDRGADGRAGRADRPRRDARGSRLGARACGRARRSSRSRRPRSRPPS
jgi:carbamoyl-phosphate synthase large subunit